MPATTALETELMALVAMRLRWRHEPDMLRMIDKAMALIGQLAETHDAARADKLAAEALAWSGLMRRVFAEFASIRVH
jgi:hypothetical protein